VGVAEAGWRLRLGIAVRGVPSGANKDGVFGFAPPFGGAMYPGTMPWLASADSASIAFDDRQLRRTRGAYCQGLVSPGVSVTTLGQFRTDIVHDPLNCLGGDLGVAHVLHDDCRPLKRTCFGSTDGDPLHQKRGQLASVKAQRFPEGGKSPDGTWGNRLLARRRT